MPAVDREYKDRLFSFIFGYEENKAWTLSLYNAINGTSYSDPSAIEITTIRQMLYLGMHNDVSFLIANEMNMFEEQSTYNPNMPVRMLQYAGNLYEKYIKGNNLNKYGKKLLALPVPKLIVFYIGKDNVGDEVIFRLSDSFPPGADADIEVRVRMLNITPGRNPALMEACEALKEYSWIMEQVWKNLDTMSTDDAVDTVITNLPMDFILRSFLRKHQAEVKGMLLAEYNEVEQMELFKEEGRTEGRAEGRAEGRSETIDKMSALMNLMIANNRTQELQTALKDRNALDKLFTEFGLN